MSQRVYFYAAACATIVICVELLASAQTIDTPQTRMRPIGSGSAVDQYRNPSRYRETIGLRETAYQSPNQSQGQTPYPAQYGSLGHDSVRQASTGQPADWSGQDSSVRQTVMLQQSGIVAPDLPGSNFNMPSTPGATSSVAPPSYPPGGNGPAPVQSTPPMVPQGTAPPPLTNNLRGTNPLPANPLPTNPPAFSPPGSGSSVVSPGSSDFAPIAQPQLSNGFATIDNCNCISAPSTYSAASGIGCGVAPCGYAAPAAYAAPQAYAAPPAQIAPQVVLPGPAAPLAAPRTAAAAPVPSLITLGQQTLPVEVGQGLWGQPVAYVPGQGFRNWLRYFFP